MATQALIWETAKNGLKVEYYTKANAGGNYIDISAERNEIMRLVNSHYDKPNRQREDDASECAFRIHPRT